MQIFKLLIDLDDDSGLTFNALVDRPAHNKRLIAFNKKEQDLVKLAFNDEKRMITGVAISSNQLIQRFDHSMGVYYVYFEPKEIEKMVLKLSRQKLLSSVNLMHDDRKIVNGITFIEGYFVSDSKRPPIDNDNTQNGSYVMTYFVEDEVLYNEIKNGKYVGYSVEGLFEQIPINVKTKKSNKMKKTNLFKMVFGKQKFAEVVTADGVILSYEGDLAVGTALMVVAEDGSEVAAPEGSHALEDGRTVVVDADGLVVEIIEAEAEAEFGVDDVVEVLKELNNKIEAQDKVISEMKENFEAFQKAQTPKGKEKFKKVDNSDWKTIAKSKLTK